MFCILYFLQHILSCSTKKVEDNLIFKTTFIHCLLLWISSLILFHLHLRLISTVVEPKCPPSSCGLRPGWFLGYASAVDWEHKPQVWWASPAQSKQLETLGSPWEKGTHTCFQYAARLTGWPGRAWSSEWNSCPSSFTPWLLWMGLNKWMSHFETHYICLWYPEGYFTAQLLYCYVRDFFQI